VLLTLQALVLGLVQGLTEFLPVSSSGHLQAVPTLLGWPSGSLAFDVMVHAGTLVAVTIAFRADLVALARGSLAMTGTHPDEVRTARRLVLLLALATVPAALVGVTLEGTIARAFDEPRVVAGGLYLTAVLLVVSERVRRRRGGAAGADEGAPVREVGPRSALAIGAAQALAIVPGVSRSGATIAAGLLMGLSRRAAARFSFLLSIPIILGTTVRMLPELTTPVEGALAFDGSRIALGVGVATLSGWAAIRILLRLVERRDLTPFAVYVTALATLLLVVTGTRA
jgi:undecaprenyl-diphosphatase